MVSIVTYSSSPSRQKPELSSSHWWPFRHHVSGATKEMCDCGSPLWYFKPSFPNSLWPRCPPWGLVVAGGSRWGALALAHGVWGFVYSDQKWSVYQQLLKEGKNFRWHFNSLLCRAILDSAAASHVKRFVSFEFSLNCITSISAPWNIRAVLFAESLIISRGLLS